MTPATWPMRRVAGVFSFGLQARRGSACGATPQKPARRRRRHRAAIAPSRSAGFSPRAGEKNPAEAGLLGRRKS
ncbi:MAG: hypothetical protein ACK5PF_07550 [bacterium]